MRNPVGRQRNVRERGGAGRRWARVRAGAPGAGRRAARVLGAGAAVLALTAGTASGAAALDRAEADLAYHGVATLVAGETDVRLVPVNHGPSAVADATVRLQWSEPLADEQPELPAGCARSGGQAVLCRTGALPVDGVGERIGLRVRLEGAPSEVYVDVDTVWSGGALDRNRLNDRQRVLVLDTGDEYHF
ncbi:hypothetical protein [Streptomyces sp. enrichment culture]|uniref:hypothetical protein n=1 Tax=Streptomyces sp. enrichment culture TaxID=1795815 RepID=UPI003F5468EF